VSAAAL